MFIRGVDYGSVWAGSGARGFFGEGYWFHFLFPAIQELTFVAKTVTLEPNKGNMELNQETWQPQKLLPDCIYVDFKKKVALNAVGLSNFGMQAAYSTGRWQKINRPFMLSFMPLQSDKLQETRAFVEYLKPRLRDFSTKAIALQVNLSCPNTGEDLAKLTAEAAEILKILQDLGIALVPKFNILTSPETVKQIEETVPIDALVVSNTIPYGQLPDRIPWKKLFGEKSPLEKYKGGGLSGAVVLPLVEEWLYQAKRIGMKTPINAGNGILEKGDIEKLARAGAKSVSVASVLMLRPWRLRGIIDEANRWFYDL